MENSEEKVHVLQEQGYDNVYVHHAEPSEEDPEHAQVFDTHIVVIPAAAGITLGSLMVYGIAYWAGKPALDKWGKWLGLGWKDVEAIQKKFSEKSFDEWGLFILRCIPILPSVAISAFSGLIRY